MSLRFSCGLLVAVAIITPLARGQSTPSLGIVNVDSVTVRGSPRADGPETSTLNRGQSVVIVRAEGEKWLAIQPPRGSLSWINHLYVKLEKPSANAFPQNAVVHADGPVKLAVGRVGILRPLDIRLATVPDGTIVKVIGPKVETTDDGNSCKWYPIEPPEDDYRYVPRDAVRLDGTAPAGFAVKSPPSPSLPRPSVEPASIRGSIAGKPAGWPNHAVWVQAEAAEKAGELDKAERLYFQLAREMNTAGGDADLANLCYTRVHALRERRRLGEGAKQASNRSESTARGELLPTATRRNEAMGKEEPASTGRGQWTGAGYLRRVTFPINGKSAYALEDNRNRVMVYAIAAAGVDLDRHVRKTVDLYGTVQHPDNLRGIGLITVSQVDLTK